MPGLFQGLEIGKRALLSHQVTLQTIGHNIANVDTPGYTRQRVTIKTTRPEDLTYGNVGTGVRVSDIRHIRDLFLRQQYREANKSLGQWTYKGKTLGQIESLFNEPQDASLNDRINKFFDAWSDLATNSDSTSHRQMVVAQAEQMVNGFNRLARQLNELREAVDGDLTDMVKKVNGYTSEIARLNQQISSMELGNTRANDLRDRRDQLTDELSNIIDVRTVEKEGGASIVYMGAMVVVDGPDSFDIGTKFENKSGQGTHRLVWDGTDVSLTNLNGQLRGLVESRDEIIPQYIAELNELASTIVSQVNEIHVQGYGFESSVNGYNFFDPRYADAATMQLNLEIKQDTSRVAAASTPDGDNKLALQLSDLRDQLIMSDNSMTISDFYHSLVGELGIETRESTSFTENYKLLAHQVDNARQSVEAVSLDEEMANMVKYQHAYDAAARVITAMDQALDTVIGSMGIVGR